MSEYIDIHGRIAFKQSTSHDTAYRVVNQIVHDSAHGTFLNFPAYWDDKWEIPPSEIASNESVDEIDDQNFRFCLRINARFFSIEMGGLQHLVGILAGDLFHLNIPDSSIPGFEITVDRLDLPASLREQAIANFRKDSAHNIQSIREAFGLAEKRPLLAFSFKPRVGISKQSLRDVTLGVLEAGFNIVELDTRNLHLDDNHIDALLSIAEEVSNSSFGHVARFSPNLSLPSHEALRLCRQFIEVQDPPYVVKIDGGMEGIGALQTLRKELNDTSGHSGQMDQSSERSPITTTYPLLRKLLEGKVPGRDFVDLLSLSGADIIYPGGRPNLGGGARTLGTSRNDQLVDSVIRYKRITDRGWPMPTIAGGVHAGELHAFYELLGPDVAYFLGGAVALHEDGPVKGAELCCRVIDEAVSLRRQAGSDREVDDLSGNLIKEVEGSYGSGTDDRFGYRSPRDIINEVYPLNSFFYRSIT